MATKLDLHLPDIKYPADGSAQPVSRHIWHPALAPVLPMNVSPLLSDKVVILTGGSEETATHIKDALNKHGATAYYFAPSKAVSLQDAQAFVEQIDRVDGIIDLTLETPFTLAQADLWEENMLRTVALLKAVYNDWVEETDSQRLFYIAITYMGGKMGYDNTHIQQPLGGIWSGFAKTLHREIPNCNVRIIDSSLGNPTELTDHLLQELYRWGLLEIGYVNGVRYTLEAYKEDVPYPSYHLGSSDLILISGGGRGIGFALAKTLATNFGCSVIVTGRYPLPTNDEHWLTMPESDFKQYQQQQLRGFSLQRPIQAIRKELGQQKQLREIYSNIQSTFAAGLRISYEVCDFTSQSQVNALIKRAGPNLSGIIHNAGIGTAVRLPAKSAGEIIRTIQTKIYGFIHLIQALEGKKLSFFCSVGSLAGRWGGLVGQTDYAAANEGLTRLGLWAEQALAASFPLKTLCWPTWDHLGLIANFDAALKYMAAMAVDEGLYYWQRELLAPSTGEITYIGRIGKAFSPSQARGYHLPMFGIAGFKEEIYPRIFYLGDVQSYKPFQYIQTHTSFAVKTAPFFTDFQISNIDALPVSMLLETIVRTAAWIFSLEQPGEHLHALRNITINLQTLQTSGPTYQIEKRAQGGQKGTEWSVTVEITRLLSTQRQALAQAELIYGQEQPIYEQCPTYTQNGLQAVIEQPSCNISWKGNVFKPARWLCDRDHVLIGKVEPCYTNDLWAIPYPPDASLPLAALENILRAVITQQDAKTLPTQITIESIELFASAMEEAFVIKPPYGDTWYVTNQGQNQVICAVSKLALHF